MEHIFFKTVGGCTNWNTSKLYHDVFVNMPQCPPQVHTFSFFPHLGLCTGEACEGCQFCGRGDVTQNEPQSHRQEHRGEKPYQCQHCPKKFSLKHQLDTHHRVHTGKRICVSSPRLFIVCQ